VFVFKAGKIFSKIKEEKKQKQKRKRGKGREGGN
jgi:hypothetical protein